MDNNNNTNNQKVQADKNSGKEKIFILIIVARFIALKVRQSCKYVIILVFVGIFKAGQQKQIEVITNRQEIILLKLENIKIRNQLGIVTNKNSLLTTEVENWCLKNTQLENKLLESNLKLAESKSEARKIILKLEKSLLSSKKKKAIINKKFQLQMKNLNKLKIDVDVKSKLVVKLEYQISEKTRIITNLQDTYKLSQIDQQNSKNMIERLNASITEKSKSITELEAKLQEQQTLFQFEIKTIKDDLLAISQKLNTFEKINYIIPLIKILDTLKNMI